VGGRSDGTFGADLGGEFGQAFDLSMYYFFGIGELGWVDLARRSWRSCVRVGLRDGRGRFLALLCWAA